MMSDNQSSKENAQNAADGVPNPLSPNNAASKLPSPAGETLGTCADICGPHAQDSHPDCAGGRETERYCLEQEVRHLMWIHHGHQGIYGDDGEMQCGECSKYGCWDYRNAPLAEVREAYQMARFERMSSPKPADPNGWIPTSAIRSAARFAKDFARMCPHTEAVSECAHCNIKFLAAWAEKLLPAPPAQEGEK